MWEILANMRKLLESMTVKVDTDSASPILAEPEVVESEPKVVEDTEPKSEMEVSKIKKP